MTPKELLARLIPLKAKITVIQKFLDGVAQKAESHQSFQFAKRLRLITAFLDEVEILMGKVADVIDKLEATITAQQRTITTLQSQPTLDSSDVQAMDGVDAFINNLPVDPNAPVNPNPTPIPIPVDPNNPNPPTPTPAGMRPGMRPQR